MTTDDITIVINTFNSDEKIFSCLDSIDSKIKIEVIENSNNIEFKTRIEKKYQNVKCTLAGINLGYAKGNNLGILKVKSKFALILNPDTTLEINAINNFLISAKIKPNFGIIAPAIQEAKDLQKNKYINQNQLIEVDNVKGFAMFFNLQQFRNIGFFDENFFIYFEEIDLCKRLKNDSKKIYLDPKIIINHIGGSSHNKSINFEMELSRNWHWMWSTFYYHKKYYGFVRALLKVSKKLLSALIKVLFYTLIFNTNKKKIYYQRVSGLLNSIIGKKSWYRPNVF
jgi:N-acetylglucosaminyl-diphospho-decaprenol L-rhamnosyltransferase